jgi:DUF2934 family protein
VAETFIDGAVYQNSLRLGPYAVLDLDASSGPNQPRGKDMNDASGPKTGTTAQFDKSTEEKIRIRAYQIFVSRNRMPGRALEDWLQAERELQPRV